jgi:23S rRNA (uracil1939-C5)-methyltransferase
MRNDVSLEAQIVDLTHDGKGVADVSGRRFFVAGALPGEEAIIRPRGRRRRYGEADLLEIKRPSGSRVSPPCEYFGRCGGCALQHMGYEAQVLYKQRAVRETLARIGGVEPARWLAPVTGPEWRYRRRARLGVKHVAGKGRVLVGFRERAAPLVTDMAHCPILVPPFDTALAALAATIERTSIRNRLPQVETAVADNGAALVFRVLEPPSATDTKLLLALGAELDADVYLQPAGPGSVLPLAASHTRALHYRLETFDVTLEFAPTDFIQVNALVNEQMVDTALALLDVMPDDRALDLYCGVGNFSLPLARCGAAVLGVEGDAGLVARATHNARRNELGAARFVTADLGEPGWGFLRERWDLVVLDPPRSGADVVVQHMREMAPRRIVYVSCHPGTLARDAKSLVREQGYRLDTALVLDMFPHTHHAEVLAIFDRA